MELHGRRCFQHQLSQVFEADGCLAGWGALMQMPKDPQARNVVVALLIAMAFSLAGTALAMKAYVDQRSVAVDRSPEIPAESNQENLLQELSEARTGAVVWLISFHCGTKKTGVHPEAKDNYARAKEEFRVAEGRFRSMKRTSGAAFIHETTLAYQSANYALRNANREQYCELDSYVEGVGWTPRPDAPADAAADYCRPVDASLLP